MPARQRAGPGRQPRPIRLDHPLVNHRHPHRQTVLLAPTAEPRPSSTEGTRYHVEAPATGVATPDELSST